MEVIRWLMSRKVLSSIYYSLNIRVDKMRERNCEEAARGNPQLQQNVGGNHSVFFIL